MRGRQNTLRLRSGYEIKKAQGTRQREARIQDKEEPGSETEGLGNRDLAPSLLPERSQRQGLAIDVGWLDFLNQAIAEAAQQGLGEFSLGIRAGVAALDEFPFAGVTAGPL